MVQHKRLETNRTTYGVDFPTQHPDIKEKYNKTMMMRFGTKWMNQQAVTQETYDIVNNKEKLEALYVAAESSFVVAVDLSVSQSFIAKKLLEHGIHAIHTNVSAQEKELELFIRDNYNNSVITNNRTILNGKEIDILLPDINTAIEYNGTYWHSEAAGKDKSYHKSKSDKATSNGLSLIHISEHQWLHNTDIIKSRLLHILGKSNKIMARTCDIVDVDKATEQEFLNVNHLQGYIPSSCCIGLAMDGDLQIIMSFGVPRFNKKYEWELLRLCTKLDNVVTGGASRLIKRFISTKSPKSIISYSNKMWGVGNVYKQIGFEFSHSSSPNYQYLKNNIIFSRYQFQKHKLKNKLDDFDSTMSEWENMRMNGYNRTWDCGNDVFVLQL